MQTLYLHSLLFNMLMGVQTCMCESVCVEELEDWMYACEWCIYGCSMCVYMLCVMCVDVMGVRV